VASIETPSATAYAKGAFSGQVGTKIFSSPDGNGAFKKTVTEGVLTRICWRSSGESQAECEQLTAKLRSTNPVLEAKLLYRRVEGAVASRRRGACVPRPGFA
jgi:hypothetical protein